MCSVGEGAEEGKGWKAKAQHVLFSNKKNKPSIVSENAFEITHRFLLSGSKYAEYVVEKQFKLLPPSKQQFNT